ncbi:MAG: EAL domain-containing protein [Hyphomonadaceae bacterium]
MSPASDFCARSRTAKRLEAEGYPLRIAINVSGRLLTDRRFVETTMEILQQAPNRISFEITESAAIDDWKIALHHLKLFANAGVRISIDDYGAGVSSLAYVQQLPAQELKIDRSFISHLTHSHRDPLLVRSTIELGHALELEVVGEGVEDAETLALLSMMGCDLVQGYFIGYPMPLDELLEFLRSDELKERIRPPSAMHFGVAV